MSELLGEAVLELDVDMAPYDRGLLEAERKAATKVAAIQAIFDTLTLGAPQRLDQQFAAPMSRVAAASQTMARQVDGSYAQMRLQQAATARDADRTAAAAEVSARAQQAATDRAVKGYAAQAAAAKASADEQEAAAARARAAQDAAARPAFAAAGPGSTVSDQSVRERLAIVDRGGESSIRGVRGPGGGSIANPVVVVMEAASRTQLGSLAAAIGESSAAGGARTTTVADGGGGGGGTTVVASGGGHGGAGRPPILLGGSGGGGGGGGFVPLPWWMGGGRRGGGGGGGGNEGVLHRLLMGGGGLVAGTAALGSVGGFAGLGAEHILTTILGLAGSATGGAVGGGLLGLGAAGQMAVGMGSDLGVTKSTITDTQTLAQAYEKVQKAVREYGAGSKQAKEAQHELNMEMAELGNTAGVKAELGLAKAGLALDAFFDKQTSNARVKAVEILQQVLGLGRTFVPLVAQAAESNLGVVNQDIKPLFAWLQGPQGIGLWNELEDNFRHNLPTAIDAGSQGLEFFLRLTGVASEHTGGLTQMLDRLFTKLNSLDNAQINGWVSKMIGDFQLWAHFIRLLGEDLYYMFKQSAGTAGGIIGDLSQMLEKLREWEKSTHGQAEIQNIFEVHKEEMEQLLRLLPPLLSGFGKIYLVLAPPLVNLATLGLKAFAPILEGIDFVVSHSKAAALALGTILVAVKAFGAAATWQGLKTGLAWLTGEEYANAAAANADAAAQGRLAGAESAAGAAGAGAAAGTGAAGAAEGAGAAAGGLGILGRLGSGASGAIEGGSLGLASLLERFGLSGAAGGIAGAGGALAPVAGAALPALAAGGAGYLATNFAANALGVHGTGKGLLEGAGTGAGIGLMLGGPLGALAGAGVGAGAVELGKLLGLMGESRTVQIKSWNAAIKESPAAIGKLIDSLKGAGAVKVAGVEEPLKQVTEQLKKAKRAQEEWDHAWNQSWSSINKFALGSGPLLRELYERFDTNMKLIAHTMGLNSATGRKLAEENVSQMVTHVLGALHNGQLGAGHAMAAISEAISRYTHGTGDQTPRIYEQMFSQIEKLYAEHKIGTQTSFQAYSTIAAKATEHMATEVEHKQREMFAQLKRQYDDGELTQSQYLDRTKKAAHDAAGLVGGSMSHIAEAIVGAMENGSLSTAEGLKILHNDLNGLLKQFGAKPLSMPQVQVYAAGAAAGRDIKKVVGGFAGGGVMQIGRAGDAGPDSIPMSIGGQDVMVGSGEVAAVFNRHQLPVVDAALAPVGGLEGLFQNVTTPHYMASGGVARQDRRRRPTRSAPTISRTCGAAGTTAPSPARTTAPAPGTPSCMPPGSSTGRWSPANT